MGKWLKQTGKSLFGNVALVALLALAISAGAGWFLWWLAGTPDMHAWDKPGDIIRTALTITAGIGAVVALVVAYRRQLNLEAAEQRLDAAETRENTKLFNERFRSAADQLGSDRAAVRLAGIHAMAGLADDWEKGRQTCIDVLCAYMKMPYDPPEPLPEDATPEQVKGLVEELHERQVRWTIIDTIGKRLRQEPKPGTWHDLEFDLMSSTIDGGNLSNIQVTSGILSLMDADIYGYLNLRGTHLDGGKIDFTLASVHTDGELDFVGSTFTSGTFDAPGLKLAGGMANLSESTFKGATVEFGQSKVTDGKLLLARSSFIKGNVSVAGASIGEQGALSFSESTFSGAHVALHDIPGSTGIVDISDSQLSGGTVDARGSERVNISGLVVAGGNLLIGQ